MSTAVSQDLDRYLAQFDRLIDPEREAHLFRVFRRAFAFEPMAEAPFVWDDLGEPDPMGQSDWPEYPYNDAFDDMGMMLLNQLRAPYMHYPLGDHHPLGIRAHYGTVILPSILGGSYQLTELSLPWAHPLTGGRPAIRQLLERGVPDLDAGLGARCLDTAAFYREMLEPFPALAAATHIYHPDLQGPFDVAHLLWGPDIFVALYDDADLVHALLDLVTETYIAWLTNWYSVVGYDDPFTVHWNIIMRGAAMIRNDTAVMLSPRHYCEFVRPYDQRILERFGGCIHFCGCGNAFVAPMLESSTLYGLHISQPELNDTERIMALAQARNVVLLDLPERYLPKAGHPGVTLRRAWIGQ